MFDPQPSDLPSNDSLPSDQPLAKETAPTGEKILEKKPKVTDIAKDLKNQQLHLTDYLLPMEKLEAAKRQEYLNQADSLGENPGFGFIEIFWTFCRRTQSESYRKTFTLIFNLFKAKSWLRFSFQGRFSEQRNGRMGLEFN
jgi:hypothetical protein